MADKEYVCLTKGCNNVVIYKGRGPIPDFCDDCRVVRKRLHSQNANARYRNKPEVPLPAIDMVKVRETRKGKRMGKTGAERKTRKREPNVAKPIGTSETEFVNSCVMLLNRIAVQSGMEEDTRRLRVLGNAQTSLAAVVEVYRGKKT